MMREHGVMPNTFTYLSIIQGCNFKGRGLYDVGIMMYTKLVADFEEQGVPDILKSELLAVVITAMRSASSVQDAMKAFVGLQTLQLEDNVLVFNALLACVADTREWEMSIHIFKHMNVIGVAADTMTYNAILKACINGAQHLYSHENNFSCR